MAAGLSILDRREVDGPDFRVESVVSPSSSVRVDAAMSRLAEVVDELVDAPAWPLRR
jgi:hypothetical protein